MQRPMTKYANKRKSRKIEAATYRRNATRDHDDDVSICISVESDSRLFVETSGRHHQNVMRAENAKGK